MQVQTDTGSFRRTPGISDVAVLPTGTLHHVHDEDIVGEAAGGVVHGPVHIAQADSDFAVRLVVRRLGNKILPARIVHGYRTWSSLPYNAQEMTWQSVEDEVERALPDLITVADQAAKQSPAGGSLRLNPELEIPKAVSALDIHLMPGCFHTEFADNDGFRWCNLCPWHKSVFGRSENAAQSWKGRCC